MANFVSAKLDVSGWIEALDRLGGPAKESLARRMAVGAGVPLRDEAKARVPKSVGPYGHQSTTSGLGSQQAGTLRDSIYLAYDSRESDERNIRYVISWNATKAWWGKLVEFPYRRPFRVYFDKKRGVYVTVKGDTRKGKGKLEQDAQPFLRPAYDMMAPRLVKLMVETGKRELPIVLSEHGLK